MSRPDSPELRGYMATAHGEIAKTGEYPFSCGLVAIDIASLLLCQDEVPSDLKVVGLYGQPIDFMGRTSPLVPTVFEGRVKWGTHLVCVSRELAYDPIVPKPTPFKMYLEEAFTVRPEARRTFKDRELAGLIARRSLMAEDIRQNDPRNVVTDLAQLRQPNQSIPAH